MDTDQKYFPGENGVVNDENEELFGAKNLSDEKVINTAEKRFNKHLKHPCGCHFLESKRDFGSDTFPRYHIEKVCDREKISNSDNHCSFDSQCMEIYHKVLLLKYKSISSDDDQNSNLPRVFRRDFFWDNQKISIDCRCTFK